MKSLFIKYSYQVRTTNNGGTGYYNTPMIGTAIIQIEHNNLYTDNVIALIELSSKDTIVKDSIIIDDITPLN